MNTLLIFPFIILLTAASISLISAIYAWRQRPRTGALSFSFMMFAVFIWLVGYMFEFISMTSDTRFMWGNIAYIGIALAPPAFLLFSLEYTGRSHWLSWKTIGLLCIEPIFVQIMLWTSVRFEFFYTQVTYNFNTPIPEATFAYGPAFWIHAVYSYLLLLAGTIILFLKFRTAVGLYRRQLAIILVAALIPWVTNIFYLLWPGATVIDPTALAFFATGLLWGWAIFGYRLMDIMPIARDTVVEHMHDGMLVLDHENYIVDINPAAERILDVNVEDVVGQASQKILSPWQDLVKKYQDVAQINDEISIIEDGNILYYDLQITPLLNKQGQQTGRLVLLRNITQRKQTEDAYYTLVNQTSQGLAILQNMVIQFANPALAEITGISLDTLISAPISTLMQNIHPEDLPKLLNALSDAARIELRFMGFADEIRWLEFSATQIQYQGTPAIQAVISDVTERKNAEHVLRQARDAAEAANRAKSTFLANMSHEIRTPLSAIIGYSEMLYEQAKNKGEDKLATRLKNIEDAGYHLLSIVNDILDISRIESGKMELHKDTFDMQSLIDTLMITIRPLVTRNNNRLTLEIADDLGDMFGDATKIKQILTNLLGNAGKFTTDGEIILRVSKEAEAETNEAFVFQVQDSGRGMELEQIPQIFQPFAQGDDSLTRQHGGTGLGLAITQHICKMMGGRIDVESQPGKGSLFTVHLPVEYAATQANISENGDKE